MVDGNQTDTTSTSNQTSNNQDDTVTIADQIELLFVKELAKKKRDRTILIAVLVSVGGVALLLIVIILIQTACMGRKSDEK